MRKEHKNPKGGLTAKGRGVINGKRDKKAVGGMIVKLGKAGKKFLKSKEGKEKDEKGKPTRLGLALRAWGFRSKKSAKAFADRHKKKKS